MMTFSFNPSRPSSLPAIAAPARTRDGVLEGGRRQEGLVFNDAFVMPSKASVYLAGCLPSAQKKIVQTAQFKPFHEITGQQAGITGG